MSFCSWLRHTARINLQYCPQSTSVPCLYLPKATGYHCCLFWWARYGGFLVGGRLVLSFPYSSIYCQQKLSNPHIFNCPAIFTYLSVRIILYSAASFTFSVAFLSAQHNFGKQNPKHKGFNPSLAVLLMSFYNKHISKAKTKFSTINYLRWKKKLLKSSNRAILC